MWADPNMGELVQREHPQNLEWNKGGVTWERKNLQCLRNGAR